MQRRLLSPERLFLIVATFTGLILCFLVPPFGGGNEMYNFQRVAAIAYGHPLVDKASVPSGIFELIKKGGGFFDEGMQAPFHYSRAQFQSLAQIPLHPDTSATLVPNPITVHHPFCYLPQALAVRLGAALGYSPLMLFYLARLSGLFASVVLTFFALRKMPSHLPLLCGLALLPPMMFSRSAIDASPVTEGLTFLFIACVLREIKSSGPLPERALALLAGLSFITAQCKSIYLMLPLLSLAIPRERFASGASRVAAMMVIILPGLLLSVVWLLLLKHSPYVNLPYHTWGGEVDPERQAQFIAQHPLSYLAIVCRTMFKTPLLVDTLMGVLGIFGPPVSLPIVDYAILIILLFGLGMSMGRQMGYGRFTQGMAAFILLSFTGIALTGLYVNWTGVKAPVISGFQGRYLLPLLPLLLVFVRPPEQAPFKKPGLWLGALTAFSAVALCMTTLAVYYG